MAKVARDMVRCYRFQQNSNKMLSMLVTFRVGLNVLFLQSDFKNNTQQFS